MFNSSITLFIEISESNFLFLVGEQESENSFKTLYEINAPSEGIEGKNIANYDKVISEIKKNVYLIEKKLNFTFKETVLILDNLQTSCLNLTGFKNLNGSQLSKENITYLLNSLKSYVDENENKKKIIHIFNSKFKLDKKKIDNLPIGLFGDVYAHELSFSLIDNNDYKNLENIFSQCNLKIKKILLKSFIIGASISDKNNDIENFFYLNLKKNSSKIFYFEDNSLKLEQKFNFGSEMIIKDILKITKLKREILDRILEKNIFKNNLLKDELIEKNYFENDVFRKIKKID